MMPDSSQHDLTTRPMNTASNLPWAKILTLMLPPLIFAFGMWGKWPYLNAEHARLRWWEIPMFWLGEITALLWYIAYVVSLVTHTHAQEHDPIVEKVKVDREYLWFLCLLLFGISADVGVGIWSLMQEREGLQRAVPAVAQVESGTVGFRPNNKSNYELHCRFVDAQGDTHTARFQPARKDIPDNVKQAIQRGKFPVDIDLTYDPLWPTRCWLKNAHNPNENRL
jgi:hypothetical protein